MNRESVLIYAVMLIAAVFSVAAQSFNFPFSNNVHHIPVVLDYANSLEGPSDTYHQSLSRFISAFWLVLRTIATEDNIYSVFLIMHVLFRFLILLMIWKIASLLSGNKTVYAALPACFILFFPGFYHNSPVGKSELFAPYLTHSQAVIAVVLVGWYFLIRRQFLRASAATGLAFNFNAFVGVWLGVVAGCTMLLFHWKKGVVFLALQSGKMLSLFLLIALPVIVWLVYSVASVPPFEEFDYRSFLIEFYAYHNYFIYHLQETIAFIVFVAIGYLLLRWTNSKGDENRRKILFGILFTYAAIFLLGMVLPYLTGNRLILNLVPLRMDSYLIFLITILILVWHGTGFSDDTYKNKAFPIIALFSLVNGNVMLFIAALFLDQNFGQRQTKEKLFGWLLITVLMVTHLYFGQAAILFTLSSNLQILAFALQSGIIAVFLLGHPRYLGMALLCIATASLRLIPEIDNPLTIFALVLTYALIAASLTKYNLWLILCAGALILLLMLLGENHTLALLVGACFLIPVIAVKAYLLIKRLLPARLFYHSTILWIVITGFLLTGIGDVFLRGGIANFPEEERAFKEAQIWARENTAPHTLFLPVRKAGFSTFSRRPVWLERTTGAMIMWAPENHEFWSKRIEKLRQIQNVSDAVSLANAEGIPFIFINKYRMPMDNAYSNCVVFENQKYVILQAC